MPTAAGGDREAEEHSARRAEDGCHIAGAALVGFPTEGNQGLITSWISKGFVFEHGYLRSLSRLDVNVGQVHSPLT